MMPTSRRNRQSGFTLVELMVVVTPPTVMAVVLAQMALERLA